jgi:hypothetical protein
MNSDTLVEMLEEFGKSETSLTGGIETLSFGWET